MLLATNTTQVPDMKREELVAGISILGSKRPYHAGIPRLFVLELVDLNVISHLEQVVVHSWATYLHYALLSGSLESLICSSLLLPYLWTGS